jgi:hypothetical protein
MGKLKLSNREVEGEEEDRLVIDGSGSQRNPGRGFGGVGKEGVEGEARLNRGVCFVGPCPEDLGEGDDDDDDDVGAEAEAGVEVGLKAETSSMVPDVEGVSAEVTIGSVSIGLDAWLMRSAPFSDDDDDDDGGGVEGLSARSGRVKSRPTREELAKEHAPTRARDATPTRLEGRTEGPKTERSTTDAMMTDVMRWIELGRNG